MDRRDGQFRYVRKEKEGREGVSHTNIYIIVCVCIKIDVLVGRAWQWHLQYESLLSINEVHDNERRKKGINIKMCTQIVLLTLR